MITAALIVAAVLLVGVAGVAVRHGSRVENPVAQLDQSDPFVLEAVREVDAEFPMLPPLLDPKIRAADEKRLVMLAEAEANAQRSRETLLARERRWREEERAAGERARQRTLEAIAAERAFFARNTAKPQHGSGLGGRAHTYDSATDSITVEGVRMDRLLVSLYGWDVAIAMSRKKKES